MICREYLDNFLVFFLAGKLYYCYFRFFLIDSEFITYFIHIFQFWCKYNKFISFFRKNLWKSSEKVENKPVDIPISAFVLFNLCVNE